MSGHLCRCGAYPECVQGRAGGGGRDSAAGRMSEMTHQRNAADMSTSEHKEETVLCGIVGEKLDVRHAPRAAR